MRSPGSRSPRSASTRSWLPASRSPTSRRARATTPRRRCRASSATPHRRPPHDLRPAVLQHRPAAAGRRDHRHHAGAAASSTSPPAADRRPRRLPGGHHHRPDGGHADPHVVPPAIHGPRSHRHHERIRPTQSNPVGESVINYGRPLEPPSETPPIRLDDPTVSAPPDHRHHGHHQHATTEPITSNPVTQTAPASGDERPRRRIEPAAVTDRHRRSFAEGWFSDPSANSQVALWGAVLILISVGSYLLSRKVRSDWVGALVGDRAVHDRVVLLLPERQPSAPAQFVRASS